MNKIIVLFKLIDHTEKKIDKHIYCVKVASGFTVENVEKILNLINDKESFVLQQSKFVSEMSSSKRHKIMINGAVKEVFNMKKYCYVYAKGNVIGNCNMENIYSYAEADKVKNEFEYDSVNNTLVAPSVKTVYVPAVAKNVRDIPPFEKPVELSKVLEENNIPISEQPKIESIIESIVAKAPAEAQANPVNVPLQAGGGDYFDEYLAEKKKYMQLKQQLRKN